MTLAQAAVVLILIAPMPNAVRGLVVKVYSTLIHSTHGFGSGGLWCDFVSDVIAVGVDLGLTVAALGATSWPQVRNSPPPPPIWCSFVVRAPHDRQCCRFFLDGSLSVPFTNSLQQNLVASCLLPSLGISMAS